MDSDQFFRYNIPDADLSYILSQVRTNTCTDWTSESMKLNIGNSPSSPLSNHLDQDTFPTLSNSQEQYSSTDNLSVISPPDSSSLEIDSFLHSDPSNPPLISKFYSWDYPIDPQNMKNVLEHIESVLMAHDPETPTTSGITHNEQPEGHNNGSSLVSPQPSSTTSVDWRRTNPGIHHDKRLKMSQPFFKDNTQPRKLKDLLIQCAKAISEDRNSDFKTLIQECKAAIAINGDPIQRLGAYMVEGLVARQEKSGTNIYRCLAVKELESKVLLFYLQLVYDICPYLRFAYMAVNGAIAEAFRNEDKVHIVDFQISQGTQWLPLIRALAARPNGAPHLRITGIAGSGTKHATIEGVEAVGKILAQHTKKLNIPFEFNAVSIPGPDFSRSLLDIRPDEALAVNFTLQLNQTRDESVDVNNPRDGLLRFVKSLGPKITTLIEQESNTNTTPFFHRFIEALDYYSAIFDSLDATLPRDSKERINIEQHCLGKDIVNIIACEGKDRLVRHELLGKWKSRFTMAGFQPYPLSSHVNSVIKNLLSSYSDSYSLVEKDGAMLLGWKKRNLFSASAWN